MSVITNEEASPLLTAKDIAKALNMPLSTVYQRAKANELPFEGIYIGRSLRFRADDVKAFLRPPPTD